MLPYIIWSFILAALWTGRAVRVHPSSALCIGTQCYGLYQSSRTFKSANRSCSDSKGHLMTVRSSVAADSISLLLGSSSNEFWIGLSLAAGVCSDRSGRLRGFKWVTGDNKTSYPLWKNHSVECGPKCVYVNSGAKWNVKSCESTADGFLCEFNYNSMCPPVKAPGMFTVTYQTPFGANESDLSAYPPATVVSVHPTGIRFTCTDQGDDTSQWKPLQKGPWDCLVENGGCEDKCELDADNPKCLCPPNQHLQSDGLSCSPQRDPCVDSRCGHMCIPYENGFVCMCKDGYELAEDNVTCKDIDDCKGKPSLCDHVCINTDGGFSCSCNDGFRLLHDNSCEDIDECALDTACDHNCNNTEGSFICFCNEGYVVDTKDSKKCILFCDTETCPPVCDPNNLQCSCPEGYVLDESTFVHSKCMDIDNCDSENYCQQLCENTFGSFICSCKEGYVLQEDKTSCKSKSEETEGSAETPFYTVPSVTSTFIIPTTNYTAVDITLTPGAVVGIIVATAVAILVFIIMIYCIIKQRGKWALSKNTKCGTDRDISLQEVSATDSCAQKFLPSNEKSRQDT